MQYRGFSIRPPPLPGQKRRRCRQAADPARQTSDVTVMSKRDEKAAMESMRKAVDAAASSGSCGDYDVKKYKKLYIWEEPGAAGGGDASKQKPKGASEATEPEMDDSTLLRFLRARKCDVAKASKMHSTAMAWRRDNGVSAFMRPGDDTTESPESRLRADPREPVYSALCPHSNQGVDREGRPIYWERTGRIRVPKLLEYVTEKDLVRRHVRQMELMTARMRASARSVALRLLEKGAGIPSVAAQAVVDYAGPLDFLKQTVVMDLQGLSYWPDTRGLAVFKLCMKIDQDFYPERLGRCYIINAPWLFTGVWAVVRHFLDTATQEKFTILGSGYKDALMEAIGPDDLLECYGGRARPRDTYMWRANKEESAAILKNVPKIKSK